MRPWQRRSGSPRGPPAPPPDRFTGELDKSVTSSAGKPFENKQRGRICNLLTLSLPDPPDKSSNKDSTYFPPLRNRETKQPGRMSTISHNVLLTMPQDAAAHTKVACKAAIALIGLQISAKNFAGLPCEMDSISGTLTRFKTRLLHNALCFFDIRVKNIESMGQTPGSESSSQRNTCGGERRRAEASQHLQAHVHALSAGKISRERSPAWSLLGAGSQDALAGGRHPG